MFYWTLVAIAASLLIYRLVVVKSQDPYGLFHLSLNEGSDTEWLNMGYWKDCMTFPEACRALATKVIQAINCPDKDGLRVLDVGHGTGDSLLLLLEHYKPRELVGITSLPAHSARSSARVKERNSGVKLYIGDAVYRDQPAGEHPFNLEGKYDVVFVLDCIYHFRTRRLFLQQAFEALEQGGRIGFTDVTFTASSVLAWSIPGENVQSDVRREMEEIGYVDVIVEDVTEDVLPSFARFLKSRKGPIWKAFGWVVGRSREMRYLVVTGTKA